MNGHHRLLSLVMASLVVLCSCSSGKTEESRIEEIRSEYSEAESLTATALVTADYGDRVYEFKLRYTGNDTEGDVEILAPESLKGLTARIGEVGKSLIYDGAELSLGDLTPDGISPMECLPMMTACWKSGCTDGSVTEKINGRDTLAVTYPIQENEQLITWFETDTNLPLRAELFFDGDMVISCEFENIITHTEK